MNNLKNLLKKRSNLIALIAIALVLVLAVGSTFALLMRESEGITNNFTGVVAKAQLNETFTDGVHKKDVSVTNTGTAPIYARIQLVSYRVNDGGDVIGGTATLPSFTPGTGWLNAGNGLYIYSKPIAVGSTSGKLFDSITLVEYTDDIGGKQAVDVVADYVVANDASAVEAAWGVDISHGVISLD